MRDPTTETAARGAQAAPAGPARRRARRLAVAALVLGALALLLVLLTRDDSHTYRFVFESAGQLVEGNIVRVGGIGVGTVEGIGLTDDNRAEVTVSVDGELAPLHRGTTATIRAKGLVGTANRYVDVHPGPNSRPELPEGAVLDTDNTTAIVEIDQLFNTLDKRTRRGLERIIHGQADWYAGRERLANLSAHYFAPGLGAFTRLVREINRDSRALERFLVQTSGALGALSERRTELTELVGNAGATARALASDTRSLSMALDQLPPALHQGSETFAALRPALDDLERLLVETGPAARALEPFLRRLRPVFDRSVPTFRQFRLLLNNPGAGNDLVDTMRELPRLERLSRRAFPSSRRALDESTRYFAFARPYIPDFTAWAKSFAGAMATYDANGHYARAMPVFDAFNFVEDDQGGHFEPKPVSERGTSPHLERGNLRRCPGAGAPPPADGSAPFVDSGELANVDCDPSQVPGDGP